MWWVLLACGLDETLDSGGLVDADSGTLSGVDSGVSSGVGADVVGVSAVGGEGDWTVSVSLLSDDLDCSHYADWWEIVDGDGALIYRRILNHSHPDEQPFTRDGGPVAVSGDEPLWVRGHQNDRGYGGAVMSGTLAAGFQDAVWPAGLGEGLEEQEPLVEECWY